MIGLLQRVSRASVSVEGNVIGEIGPGLCVLVGVQAGDTETDAQRLAERLLAYRVFPDAQGRMNLSLAEVGGALLLVPQFTLAADTAKGNRPSFTPAAAPEEGARLFSRLVEATRQGPVAVATGEFGAHMQVALVNDGPVTFWLQTRK